MAQKGSTQSKKTASQASPGKYGLANHFPIVGIGASAGGLDALKSFFSKVSPKSGIAYIVIVHLNPKQPSILYELLDKLSNIPVSTAKDGQRIQPDHVYIKPSDRDIDIYHGTIQLVDIVREKVPHPIDLFFRSLALDQKDRAAAVVLSGTGTDGTLGIRDIKEKDGLVLVQSEQSAKFDGMPKSAIQTGVVDVVLPPEEMPEKLVAYFSHPPGPEDPGLVRSKAHKKDLDKIFSILRSQVGHDFSTYKINTIQRRIDRRMSLHNIQSPQTYVRFLRENPEEVETLFRDMLIGVTSFFRDPESFHILAGNILPDLMETLEEGETFRVWIPGCSTGEEVYSLAIVIRECLETVHKKMDLQIFGTDIDEKAIEKAREGIYTKTISVDVSPNRLKKYFLSTGDHYRVRKEIRDCVVFSVQNVIKDPPFSRLNLLCCRNLLIYLDTEAQKKLLPLFHYTLRKNGILILGTSESIGGFSRLFQIMDQKWKIFRRREIPEILSQAVEFPCGLIQKEIKPIKHHTNPPPPLSDVNHLTQKAIIEAFAPTAILVDSNGDILSVQGRTWKYLETPSGRPTHNLLDIVKKGLRLELSMSLRKAKSTNQPVVRRQITYAANGDSHTIDLHINPHKPPHALAGNFLVVFKDIDPAQGTADMADNPIDSLPELERIADLEKELQDSRENHQTTIEELESSNEELKSTNEELQSSNEELQSTNEELESSKEELQSLNEELQTVNSELQNKVAELSSSHDDMQNLLNSIEIATIFVDNDMNINRYTPETTHIINLIPTDIGRPLTHVTTNLTYSGITADLNGVLTHLTPKETEVQTTDGHWYKMRMIPYRTTDNRIEGAIICFLNITAQKNAQKLLEEDTKELVRSIFDMNTDPLVVLDDTGKMIIGNKSFSGLFKIGQDDISGKGIQCIDAPGMEKARLQTKLATAIQDRKPFKTDAVNLAKKKTNFTIEGRVIQGKTELPYRILLRFIRQ